MAYKWLFSTALIALTGAGGLATAPAQAAVMQVVFEGVGMYRNTEYRGVRIDGSEARNETVLDYGLAGVPFTATYRYDTSIGTVEGNRYNNGNEDSEQFSLEKSLISLEIKAYNEVLYSLADLPEDNQSNRFTMQRVTWTATQIDDPGISEEYYVQFQYNPAPVLEAGSETSTIYLSNNDFYAYRSFLPFLSGTPGFDLPFSVVKLDSNNYNGGFFGTETATQLYGEDGAYLGYDYVYDTYTWNASSLTVTRLDSPEPPTPAPVPLPAGAPLVLSGLAAFAGLRRMKRRAA